MGMPGLAARYRRAISIAAGRVAPITESPKALGWPRRKSLSAAEAHNLSSLRMWPAAWRKARSSRATSKPPSKSSPPNRKSPGGGME